MKAIARIVQPKPISGMRWDAIMGMMMPPRPLPAAIIPYAAPRFLKNQVGIVLVAALKIQLRPRGLQIAWARINW